MTGQTQQKMKTVNLEEFYRGSTEPIFLAYLAAAETAREGAVTGKTHADQARAWSRWEKYCGSIGIIEDEFLDQFT